MNKKIILFLPIILFTIGLSIFQVNTTKGDVPEGWFSFVIPSEFPENSIVDLSNIFDEGPAGSHGYLNRDGRYLKFEDGTRMKAWGVNGYPFITHEEAEMAAERYKALGVNTVRILGIDKFDTAATSPRGLLDKDPSISNDQEQTTQNFKAERLDQLDYYIYQMKLKGIYVDLSLFNDRPFTEADGVINAQELAEMTNKFVGSQVALFDPTMIALQKNYASDILNHYNPYTEMYYKEDPAISFVEISNEYWIRLDWGFYDYFNPLSYPDHKHLPDYYLQQLDDLWNEWLENKYNSVNNVIESWAFEEINEELISTSSWVFVVQDDCSATNEISENELNINISIASSSINCIYLRQPIDIVANGLYKISFTASSSPERLIKIHIGQKKDDGSYSSTNNLVRDISLEENYNEYEIYFIGKNESAEGYLENIGINMGDLAGNISLRNLSIEKISGIEISESEYSGGFNFGRPEYEKYKMYPDQRVSDLMEFYNSIYEAYSEDMIDYIKNDIRYPGIVNALNSYLHILNPYANRNADFTSIHGYQDSPNFIDGTHISIYKDSVFDRPSSSPIVLYSQTNVHGMPLLITEWNSHYFTDYNYEFPTMLPIYSSFFDWDGAMLFQANTFRNIPENEEFPRLLQHDSFADPQKMSLLLAGSLIFRNQLIATSIEEFVLPMSHSDVISQSIVELNKMFIADSANPYNKISLPEKFNLNNLIVFKDKISIDFSDDPIPVLPEIEDEGNIWSNTGEILFSPSSRRMIADNEKINVFLGDSSGGVEMSHMDIISSEKGSILLIPLDNKNISESDKILLLAVSEIRNTNQNCVLSEDRDGRDIYECAQGNYPTLFKDMNIELTLKNIKDNVSIYSLNEDGTINEEISVVEESPGEYSFDFPDETIWCIITNEKIAPFAEILVEDNWIKENESAYFSADIIKGSTDIASYIWNFGDGYTATGLEQTHSFSHTGDYDISLTVYDENNLFFIATTSVTVHPDNSPPIFTDLTSKSTNIGENIKFLVKADDPDNTNLFPNSSFEEETSYWSQNWIISEQSWYTPNIVADEAILGEKSVFFEPKYEGIGSTIQSEEYISIEPETDYNFQFLAKGENIIIGDPLWHRLIAVGKWYDNSYNIVGATTYIYLNGGSESTFDWKFVSKTATSPADASYFKITFLGIPRTGTGKGWVDAIEMKKNNGDQVSYSADEIPSGASFDETTGIFSWTPDETGLYNITFTATDGNASTSEEITITVQRPCEDDFDCDDGLYCTASDICIAGICQNSIRDCSDGISCTVDSCNEDADTCVHTANHDFCDDDLYCNGIETCDLILGCQDGTAIDCSINNISAIAECYYSPDGIDYTWDYRAGFTSVCNEEEDSCTTGEESVEHACNKLTCNAECEEEETNTGGYYCDGQIIKYDNYVCSLEDCLFQYESSTEIQTCSGSGERNMCWDGSNLCNHCNDGIDNDEDGCIDYTDSDCGGKDTTNDGIDDDCDGFIDDDYIEQTYTGMGWRYPTPISNTPASSPKENLTNELKKDDECIFDCAKTTFILYIINPDETSRETYSNFVKIERFGNNVFQFNFEDSGKDFDYNDFIAQVDKSSCEKIIITPLALDAGWHHQIKMKLFYNGILKKNLLLWPDSHKAIGDSQEIDLANYHDMCTNKSAPFPPISSITPQTPTCSSSIYFNDNIFPDSQGKEVLALQKLLICLGYFPKDILANGYYGPTTKASVIAIQKDNNILPTGNVGPLTRTLLNKY